MESQSNCDEIVSSPAACVSVVRIQLKVSLVPEEAFAGTWVQMLDVRCWNHLNDKVLLRPDSFELMEANITLMKKQIQNIPHLKIWAFLVFCLSAQPALRALESVLSQARWQSCPLSEQETRSGCRWRHWMHLRSPKRGPIRMHVQDKTQSCTQSRRCVHFSYTNFTVLSFPCQISKECVLECDFRVQRTTHPFAKS